MFLILLLEGQTVHMPAPKSHFAKDLVFDADTPIFSTGKHELSLSKRGVLMKRKLRGCLHGRMKILAQGRSE